MEIKFGQGKTIYGPGVEVNLTSIDLVNAINAFAASRGVHINGPATITVNGQLCQSAQIYVDPSGFVVDENRGYKGNGQTF